MRLIKIVTPLILCLIMPFAMTHDLPPFFQQVLEAHNKARAEEGIGPLKWNDTLAAYAATYASQRVGDCECTHSNGPYGENIGSYSANVTGEEFVKIWAGDEKPFYDRASNKCKGGDCTHYTQLVWKDTVSVGCAKVKCKNNGWFLLNCEYDPPGNYIDERPF